MILPDLLYQVVSVESFTIIDDKFIKQTTRLLDNLMDDSSSPLIMIIPVSTS